MIDKARATTEEKSQQIRIAIVEEERCKPNKCALECKK